MFARLSAFTSSLERLDEGIAVLRDKVLPEIEKQPGFDGAMLLAGVDAEIAYAVTFWKTEEELAATAESGQRFAEMAARQLDLDVQVTNCEVAFAKFPTGVA